MDSLWTWPLVLLWKLSLDMAHGIVYGQSLDLALSLLWKLSLDMAFGFVYGQSLDLALSFVMEIVSTWPLALFMDSLWTWPSVLLWKLSLDMAL